MEATGNSRALPIDATLIDSVLVRLRKEAGATHTRWKLGDRGSVELDVHFMPVMGPSRSGPTWISSARLWDPAGLAVATMTVEVVARTHETADLVMRPTTDLHPWWEAHKPALVRLAIAALDELAEEMLWHATRQDVAQV